MKFKAKVVRVNEQRSIGGYYFYRLNLEAYSHLPHLFADFLDENVVFEKDESGELAYNVIAIEDANLVEEPVCVCNHSMGSHLHCWRDCESCECVFYRDKTSQDVAGGD